jgi:hypothetical protein
MRSRLLPALGGGASRPAHRMVHEHDGGGPDVDARGLALGADGSTEGHDKLNKELGRGRRPFPSSRGLARGPEPDRGEGIRLGIPMQCNPLATLPCSLSPSIPPPPNLNALQAHGSSESTATVLQTSIQHHQPC